MDLETVDIEKACGISIDDIVAEIMENDYQDAIEKVCEAAIDERMDKVFAFRFDDLLPVWGFLRAGRQIYLANNAEANEKFIEEAIRTAMDEIQETEEFTKKLEEKLEEAMEKNIQKEH